MPRERVPKPIGRRVIRRRIPFPETLFGIGVLVCLALIGLWVVHQKEHFDPADRTPTIKAAVPGEPEPSPPSDTTSEPSPNIFPDDIATDGWSIEEPIETYDPRTLYRKIDGAAERFLSHGFRRLHCLRLTDGTHGISIEVYDQGTPENAAGLFNPDTWKGRPVIVSGPLTYFTTSIGAIGTCGRWYFEITADDDDPVSVETARDLAEAMARLPNESPDTVGEDADE